MTTSGFDPILLLNRHIALLTLLKSAEQDVKATKGVVLALTKWTGRVIQSKLEESKATMRANKMWVQDIPIGERRYQYSLYGRREVYEIIKTDIELNVGMLLNEMEQELESLK